MDKIGKLKYDIINNNYLYYCTFFSDEKQNGCNSLLSIKEAVSYVLLNLPNFSIIETSAVDTIKQIGKHIIFLLFSLLLYLFLFLIGRNHTSNRSMTRKRTVSVFNRKDK